MNMVVNSSISLGKLNHFTLFFNCFLNVYPTNTPLFRNLRGNGENTSSL